MKRECEKITQAVSGKCIENHDTGRGDENVTEKSKIRSKRKRCQRSLQKPGSEYIGGQSINIR